MDDSAAALRPLDEAAEALDRLRNYESKSDLAAAIVTVHEAVDRSLRRRLRSDATAPEADRLSALSTRDLPLGEVVRSLRTRDVISLEMAGSIHELDAAGTRARAGEARAADADAALRAVSGLRAELAEAPPVQSTPREDAGPAVSGEAQAVVPPERRGRGMAWFGAGLALVFLVALGWVLTRGGSSEYDAAVAAFRAGRLDSAAVGFERIAADRPSDVDARLYLGRIHRRQGRMTESAEVLREAVRIAPADPDVRREIGHLFMALGQPRTAVGQYERALEADPEESRTWAALIRALRAAGDPRAERMLADAPPDVQALLAGTGS